jgi:hypothetical protein
MKIGSEVLKLAHDYGTGKKKEEALRRHRSEDTFSFLFTWGLTK